MVDFSAMAAYEPRWPGVKELNFADQWRARWVDERELPENAPVDHAYAMVMYRDKGYAARPAGSAVWGMVEGQVGDAPVDAWLSNALREQAGVTAAKTELIGFFECKATRLNPDYQPGDLTVRPLYVAAAQEVDDMPDGSAYERRRFPLNEYIVAMRARYPELIDYLGMGDARYAVMRSKGEASPRPTGPHETTTQPARES